jgi:hypothetical protein
MHPLKKPNAGNKGGIPTPKFTPPDAPKFNNSAAGRKTNLAKSPSPPKMGLNVPTPPAGMPQPLAPKQAPMPKGKKGGY